MGLDKKREMVKVKHHIFDPSKIVHLSEPFVVLLPVGMLAERITITLGGKIGGLEKIEIDFGLNEAEEIFNYLCGMLDIVEVKGGK